MLPRDYVAMTEGYNNKKRKEAELLRLSVWAAKGNWEGSITFPNWCNRFFPLWFDETKTHEPIVMSEQDIKKILARHDKLHKKVK